MKSGLVANRFENGTNSRPIVVNCFKSQVVKLYTKDKKGVQQYEKCLELIDYAQK